MRKINLVINLDSFKATPVGDIPVNMLKSTVDMHLHFIIKIINLSFEKNHFTDDLKLAEVSPVFKKDDDLDEENYRNVSVLSYVPKVFERIVYNEIDSFMKDKLSKLLTGFRKNHSTQLCLMCMSEIRTGKLDNGDYVCPNIYGLIKGF